jgi:hypothetical protein
VWSSLDLFSLIPLSKVLSLILFQFAPKRYPHWLSNSKKRKPSSAFRFNSNTNPGLSVCVKFINFRFLLFTPLGDFHCPRGPKVSATRGTQVPGMWLARARVPHGSECGFPGRASGRLGLVGDNIDGPKCGSNDPSGFLLFIFLFSFEISILF